MVKILNNIQKVLKVLQEFTIGLRLKHLSEKTNIPVATLYRTLKWLIQIGIVDLVGNRYKLSPLTTSLLNALSNRFDLNYLLSPKYLYILVELHEPKTIYDLLQVLGISEKTLKKRLSELMAKNIIQRHSAEKYCLVNDSALLVLANLVDSVRAKIPPRARIILSKGEEKVFSLPKGDTTIGIKTAFSRFSEFGIQVESPYEYYYYPERELSIEDIIIHSIAAAENDPYKLALVAVLIMKNYEAIDHDKLKQLAVKYGVYDELIKLDLYIHGEEPAEADLLPISELGEIAKKYGVNHEKFLVKTFSEQMLWEIGKNIDKRVRIFIFGGAAMALKGYKERTKDVDILVPERDSLEILVAAAEKLGYRSYRNQDVAILEHSSRPRIDIYCKHILNKVYLTDTMITRAKSIEYGNLEVLVADDTDIALTKSVAGRMRDVNDIILLIRQGKVRWREMLDEILEQEKLSKKHLCIRVLNVIELIQDKLRIEIPIYRKLYRIAAEHMVEYAYKELGLRTVKEIQRYFGFPEQAIRRALKKLTQGS